MALTMNKSDFLHTFSWFCRSSTASVMEMRSVLALVVCMLGVAGVAAGNLGAYTSYTDGPAHCVLC